MSLKTAAAALALVLVPFSAASAAEPVSVTLASTVAKAQIIAGSVVFYCEGTACSSASDTSVLNARQACSAIARKFGVVTAFGSKDAMFDEAKLTKCNEKAKK